MTRPDSSDVNPDSPSVVGRSDPSAPSVLPGRGGDPSAPPVLPGRGDDPKAPKPEPGC